MKSRLLIFTCTETISTLRATTPCAICLSKWIRDGAIEHDAAAALNAPSLPSTVPPDTNVLGGMDELAAKAKLPQAKASALAKELLSLGAVDVVELSREDWQSLSAFGELLPFEQKRLLSSL